MGTPRKQTGVNVGKSCENNTLGKPTKVAWEHQTIKDIIRATETARWAKVRATKPDEPSSILRTHVVEEENQFRWDVDSGQSIHSYTQSEETHFFKKNC